LRHVTGRTMLWAGFTKRTPVCETESFMAQLKACC
jgi:hypothetical protein